MGIADRGENVEICSVTETLGGAGGEGTAVLLTFLPGCLNFSGIRNPKSSVVVLARDVFL